MKNILFPFMLFLLSVSVMASKAPSNKTPFDFEAQMKNVDSLMNLGQPQSALKVLLPLKAAAEEDGQTGYFVVAVQKEIELNSQITDNNSDSAKWNSILKEISKLKYPNRAHPFLHLYAANLLNEKFNQNHWNTNNKDDNSTDWNNWSNEKLVKLIKQHCANAFILVSHHSYMNLNIRYGENMKPLVQNYEEATIPYTVEQMVILEIIERVSNIELTADNTYKSPNKEKSLAPMEAFRMNSFNLNNDPKNEYYILHLYQELAGCIGDDEIEKRIVFDLKRLNYAKKFDNSTGNKVWLQAVENLYETNKNNAYSNWVATELVNYYKETNKVKARSIAKEAIAKYPDFKFNAALENSVLKIEKTSYSLITENIAEPNKAILAKLNYANLTKVYVQVYKIDYLKYTTFSVNNRDEDTKQNKLKATGKLVANYEITVPEFTDFKTYSAEIPFRALPKGQYVFVLSDLIDSAFEKEQYIITDVVQVSEIVLRKLDYENEIFVNNAKEGTPEKGLSYKVFFKNQEYKNGLSSVVLKGIKEGTTDKNGKIDLNAINDIDYKKVLIQINGNEFFYEKYLYVMSQTSTEIALPNSIQLFTDRNLYRPGQTVYFKGIVFNNEKKQVVANESVEVVLKDVNYQEKGKLSLKTNEFGSVADSFVLPIGGSVTGSFHIEAMSVNIANNATYFSVEEYKRPKYSAEIVEPTTAFKLGDLVRIEGKAHAYAGYAVQGANVSYSVTRSLKPKYYWWGYRGYPNFQSESVVIVNAEVKTNEKGFFDIEFTAIPDMTVNEAENPYFNYEIAATVIDLNGEVHQASYTLTLAYTDMQLSISGEEQYLANNPIALSVAASNLQGKPLPLNAEITIEKQIVADKIYREKLWGDADTIAITEKEYATLFPDYEYPKEPTFMLVKLETVNAKTDTIWSIHNIKEEGTYRAIIKAKDANGKMLSESVMFEVVPNKKGKYSAPKTLDLTLTLTNGVDFQPNQTAKILISSGKEALVHVLINSLNGEILNKTFELCKESKWIEIPITEKDRGNISVRTYTINNYRLYEETVTIKVPFSNKELHYTVKSIRDKTEPGAKEKWVLTIKGNDANKVFAEHLANMYDQSLDALNYSYNFDFWPYDNYYNRYWIIDRIFKINEAYGFDPNVIFKEDEYDFTEPDFNFLSIMGYGNGRYAKREMMYDMVGSSSLAREDNGAPPISSETIIKGASRGKEVDEKESPTKENTNISNPPPPIRQNFNETAFFFPQMLTNAEGDLVLEFTMPESLTQWKLMLLGHTKDLKIGTLTQSITTSKKVMVQPDVPRFLREKDKINIVTKVVNTTAEDLPALATIHLTDAATGESLNWLVSKNNIAITIPANQTKAVGFDLYIPNYTGIIDMAITATAGAYSDGELHTLPVLTNRKLITESLPITVTEKGTQNLVFQSLNENKSSTLKHHQFSIELCSNPAWYAVQSLPYLIEFPYVCAEQTFSRLYADLLANHIAKNNPNIQPMLKKWEMAAKKDSTILLSKLSKNQDLKSTIIAEIPWLLDAQKETAQMQQLTELFNQTRIDNAKAFAFDGLKEMQNSSGGWGWFVGMNPNAYITQTIVIGFGKMKKMGIDISEYNDMIEQAMNFLDADARNSYNYYIAQKAKGFTFLPNNLQYLYCKCYFPELGTDASNEVVQFFISNAEKSWNSNNLINKAQLVTALNIIKPKSPVPALIIKSLTETAIKNKEMGMYWKQNNGGYYWYQAPIETQAAIIEAFINLNADPQLIMQQQIWLLRQKQTQNWKTTRATADACYALLMSGSNWLNSPLQIIATSGNMVVSTEKGEPGTGYIRQNLPVENINVQTASIKVEARSNNFGYGAAYWQYFEDLDKIKENVSGIAIEKKLYKLVNTATGVQKVLLTANDSLRVGDIIEITLNVKTDRNLEYVHIKDLRGSGTEPIDVLSAYKWQNGAGYYQTTLDASTNFFVDYLNKGNYQFNYPLKVQQAGVYNAGLATVQCMYAPEFMGNSKSLILKVK